MFPGLTSSHHIHHMGAKAVAFAEALEFGKDYADEENEAKEKKMGMWAGKFMAPWKWRRLKK